MISVFISPNPLQFGTSIAHKITNVEYLNQIFQQINQSQINHLTKSKGGDEPQKI